MVNGNPRGGTYYFDDGGCNSGYYDDNIKRQGLTYLEREDGSWRVGRCTNSKLNGLVYDAERSGDSYIYYRETWSNGERLSREEVDEPDWNDPIVSHWFSDIHPPKSEVNYSASPGVNYNYSNNYSNNYDNSSSSTSSTITTNVCPCCHGSRRQLERTISMGTFGIDTSKHKCPECGAWLFAGDVHVHSACTCCHGKGVQRFRDGEQIY